MAGIAQIELKCPLSLSLPLSHLPSKSPIKSLIYKSNPQHHPLKKKSPRGTFQSKSQRSEFWHQKSFPSDEKFSQFLQKSFMFSLNKHLMECWRSDFSLLTDFLSINFNQVCESWKLWKVFPRGWKQSNEISLKMYWKYFWVKANRDDECENLI